MNQCDPTCGPWLIQAGAHQNESSLGLRGFGPNTRIGLEINWVCLRIGCKTNSGRSSLCPFKWQLFKLVYLNYSVKRSSSDSKRETNMETTNRPFCCCNPCFLVLEGVLDRPPQTFFQRGRRPTVKHGKNTHVWHLKPPTHWWFQFY
jgi:hypothetical protein